MKRPFITITITKEQLLEIICILHVIPVLNEKTPTDPVVLNIREAGGKHGYVFFFQLNLLPPY